MKLVYIADLHLRASAPINRKDDYVEEQFRKLDFIIDYVNSVDGVLLIGGDVFDRATNHPSWFLNRIIRSFTSIKYISDIIPGNHDLLGHSLETFDANSICLLDYLGRVRVFKEQSVMFYDKVQVQMLPFGCTFDTSHITNPMDVPCPNKILLLHEPVFEDTVPFYMPDALNVEQLEKKYPGFAMYLAGDIHIPCQKSKTLVSGSMMRMTTAQKDHKPRFYVIDSDTLEVETVFIPINEDVWKDVSETVDNAELKEELKELALAMQERDEQLDYSKVCEQLSGDYWGTFDKLINEYKSKKEK